MPWQSLPVELQQQILGAAAEGEIWCDDRMDDRLSLIMRNRALATLRTVCRDWNDLTTPLMFHHVFLPVEKSVEALLRLLGDRTTGRRLAAFVQHITVFLPGLGSDLLLSHLSFFPSLTSLDGLVWPNGADGEQDGVVVGPRPRSGVQLAHLSVNLYHASDDINVTSPPVNLANLVSFTVDLPSPQVAHVWVADMLLSLPALRHLCLRFGEVRAPDNVWQLASVAVERVGEQLETFQLIVYEVQDDDDDLDPPAGLLGRLPNVRRLTLPDDRALRHPCPTLPHLRRLYLVEGAPQIPVADDTEDLKHWRLEKPGAVYDLLSSPAPATPSRTDTLHTLRELGFYGIDFSRPGDVASPSVRLAADSLKAKGITLLDFYGRSHPAL